MTIATSGFAFCSHARAGGYAGEEVLPVRIVDELLFLRNRVADCGNMRCGESANDARHGYSPCAFSIFLNSSTEMPRLLRANVLHGEAEDSGKFCEVVDASAVVDHGEDVAFADGLALLVGEAVLAAVGVFVSLGIRARFSALLNEKHILLRL